MSFIVTSRAPCAFTATTPAAAIAKAIELSGQGHGDIQIVTEEGKTLDLDTFEERYAPQATEEPV